MRVWPACAARDGARRRAPGLDGSPTDPGGVADMKARARSQEYEEMMVEAPDEVEARAEGDEIRTLVGQTVEKQLEKLHATTSQML